MQISLNDRVQQLIDSFVESGAEVGLQVAAYIDGELIVDAPDLMRSVIGGLAGVDEKAFVVHDAISVARICVGAKSGTRIAIHIDRSVRDMLRFSHVDAHFCTPIL